jgi:predicted GIY-YIG superfamily endonuclease
MLELLLICILESLSTKNSKALFLLQNITVLIYCIMNFMKQLKAIDKEKQLNRWKRSWKDELIK